MNLRCCVIVWPIARYLIIFFTGHAPEHDEHILQTQGYKRRSYITFSLSFSHDMNNRPEQPSQQSWYDGRYARSSTSGANMLISKHRAPQSDPRANQNDLALQATLAYQELITPVGAYPPRHRSQGSHTNASGSVYPGYEQGAPLNHQMPLRGGWDQPSSTHGRGASPSSPSQHLNQMNWVPSRQGSAGPSSRALEPTSFQGPLSPTDSDGMDSTSVTEDKRKRNTAASGT